MKLLKLAKEVYYNMFPIGDIENAFKLHVLIDDSMQFAINTSERIYIDNYIDKFLKSTKFYKTISSEIARLTTLDLDITVSNSPRADYLQSCINQFKNNVRSNLEYAIALGGIALKPNGNGIDFITPPRFLPTDIDGNGNITGAIFLDFIQRNDKIYTKAEYHHFIDDIYFIENKAFESNSKAVLGMPIPLKSIT